LTRWPHHLSVENRFIIILEAKFGLVQGPLGSPTEPVFRECDSTWGIHAQELLSRPRIAKRIKTEVRLFPCRPPTAGQLHADRPYAIPREPLPPKPANSSSRQRFFLFRSQCRAFSTAIEADRGRKSIFSILDNRQTARGWRRTACGSETAASTRAVPSTAIQIRAAGKQSWGESTT